MKTFKKLTALLLTFLLTCSMSMVIFAAAGTTGSIVIGGTKAGENRNIVTYRMFTTQKTGTTVDYTLESVFKEFFTSDAKYGCNAPNLTDAQISDQAAAYLDKIQRSGNAMDKQEFSKEVLAWVMGKEKSVSNTFAAVKSTTSVTEGTTTITNLPYGFYMVYTMGANNTADVETVEKTPAMMITVADETPVNITIKSEYPTVDKTIDPGIQDPDDVTPGSGSVDLNINDNWQEIHGMELESTVVGGNAGDFQVGDVVTFKLTAKVPDMTGFTDYTFKFHDTLSSGLTLQAIQKVTVGTTDIKPVQEMGAAVNTYSVKLEGQHLTIIMNKFLESYKNMVGQEITVYYKAVVNEDAVIGMNPNTNTAQVEFSNNPNQNTTDKSEEDVVNVHTFGFDIFKFVKETGNKKPLAGAEFRLYLDEQANTKIELAKQTDGKTWVVSTDATDDNIITPGDGKVTVKGLKAGTYYLKEIKAPDGFHMLKSPIKIEIKAHYNTQNGKLESYDVDYTYEGNTVHQNVAEGMKTITVEVENKNGTILPNTGGMGTVLFTVVGIVLILGVAISFIKSRKKEDK